MGEKLISISQHPAVIAAVIALCSWFVLPDFFPKYVVELTEKDTIRGDYKVYFQDLDGDSLNEKIFCYNNYRDRACFKVHDHSGALIDQWNFDFRFSRANHALCFSDVDQNGKTEVSLAGAKGDSIFFNFIEPLADSGFAIENLFLDTLSAHTDKAVYFGENDLKYSGKAEDLNLYFCINSGFSTYPRNLYRVNVQSQEVLKSPHLGNKQDVVEVMDFTGNGKLEIVLSGYSSGNEVQPGLSNLNDTSYWITVLDENLQFLFEPIELKSKFTSVDIKPVSRGNKTSLFCYVDSKRPRELPCQIMEIDSDGEIIQSTELPAGRYRFFHSGEAQTFTLIDRTSGSVFSLDYKLQILATHQLRQTDNFDVLKLDLDHDRASEWLVYSVRNEEFSIYQNGFVEELKVKLPEGETARTKAMAIERKDNSALFGFQRGGEYFVFGYRYNDRYYLQYAALPGVFVISLVLVWLIARGQKYREQKKIAIQNQISELQVKAISNQVEPHFLFNAMNTISSMLWTDEKEKADKFITEYSQFMRQTLRSSDKIAYTLKEELEYIENYIELQKVKHNNSFGYEICIDPSVDLKQIVPKHVLYSYVENSIKHGLSGKKNGKLQIKANFERGTLYLIVRDNGFGLNGNSNSRAQKIHSTGSGFKIMEQIYALYSRIHKGKITHRMEEVLEKDEIAGVRVEVKITR